MNSLNVLPANASLLMYFFLCIIVLIVFRFGISNIKFLFINNKNTFENKTPPLFFVISIFEILILIGLLANISVYYSFEKSWYIRTLYHLISIFILGAEMTKNDRQIKSSATSAFTGISIIFFITLLFWDWLRQSFIFSFFFNFLN